MIKQITQFKSTIQEIENIFHFDSNCPIEIAKQALFDCLKWIDQLEDEAKKKKEEENKQEIKMSQELPVIDEVKCEHE